MHPGDKLLDGTIQVDHARRGSIVVQEVNDPLSLVKQREVRKLLRSLEERQGVTVKRGLALFLTVVTAGALLQRVRACGHGDHRRARG